MAKFKHKKSLGQNFLKDENVLRKIKDSIQVSEDDLILEIGPGQGALTKYLIEYGCEVICFEIDKRVEPYLEKYKNGSLEIIFDDFLNVDILNIVKNYHYKNLYVVANLPYYITTPIITKLIESKLNIQEMVLMVQNEVADRFTAKPGCKDYGSITVYLNYFYDIEKLFFVKRTSFSPAPNVDSAVIKFKKKVQPYKVKDEALFFKLIRDAFQFKRKNIKNNLKNYDLNLVEQVLLKSGYNLSTRAEQLPIEIFVEIANLLNY